MKDNSVECFQLATLTLWNREDSGNSHSCVLEEGELFEPNSERKKEEETKLNKFAQPVQLFIAHERV